ncbi:MAG: hypothetical protein ACE365_07975 [Gammaproteobacteria bacterium]
MSLIKIAKKLLDWNSENLIHDSVITNEKIATLFAENFSVKANGRTYQANYDNYREFLYQFKANISSIAYDVDKYIEAKPFVTIPMRARVARTDGSVDMFEAILILEFDDQDKIILWQEVYIKFEDV